MSNSLYTALSAHVPRSELRSRAYVVEAFEEGWNIARLRNIKNAGITVDVAAAAALNMAATARVSILSTAKFQTFYDLAAEIQNNYYNHFQSLDAASYGLFTKIANERKKLEGKAF